MTPTHEALERLAAAHGDAFWLLDARRFEANCVAFRDAFRRRWPRTQLAYSYKTNYLPRLCRIVQALGGWAEVVSGMEYDLARRLGVPADRILFNGPGKPTADLERALLDGAVVNLDAPREVALVEAAARRAAGRPLAVGLRCTFDPGDGSTSRFGFDADGDELAAALARLRRVPGCRVVGLACHFVTRTRSVDDYARIADRMATLATAHFPDAPPAMLDLGGGFLSPMPPALARQFPFPVPSWDAYADAIGARLAARWPGGDGPELVLEPGMTVVADAMRFVARVVDVRHLRGRRLAVVAGSVYDVKPTKSPRNLPMTVVGPGIATGEDGDPVDVVGCTCMEDDRLFAGHRGGIAAGDFVVFENVGAYSLVLRPPFIRPCPPVLEVGPDGAARVVKRGERLDDVIATHVLR